MIKCTVPGHEADWIRVKEHVSRKEWKEWTAEHTADEVYQLVISFLAECSLTTGDGAKVTQLTDETLDMLDLEMLPWLVGSVSDELVSRLQPHPQPSAPLPSS